MQADTDQRHWPCLETAANTFDTFFALFNTILIEISLKNIYLYLLPSFQSVIPLPKPSTSLPGDLLTKINS